MLLQSTLTSRRVAQLAYRFRKVPPFGRTTIRRFRNNVSELKQMAGRDYEDILQVSTAQCQVPMDAEFPFSAPNPSSKGFSRTRGMVT